MQKNMLINLPFMLKNMQKNVKNANKNADPHSENKGYLLALGSEG